MKENNKRILLYIALLIGAILLIKSISELDFENIRNGPFSGIISYGFFTLIFIRLIREQKRKSE